MAVAAAGYLAVATPNDIGATGALPLIRTPHGVARTGTFGLCGRISQENCVIDGDTIRYGGVKIRLADIDAPEIGNPKCASEAALGDRATQRLLELMNAGPFQVVRTGERDKDMYGRKLRVIARNGRSVADTLVAEGLARRWDGARRSWCG
jgi:micrococcal nuclease